jgi:hypothetical protein
MPPRLASWPAPQGVDARPAAGAASEPSLSGAASGDVARNARSLHTPVARDPAVAHVEPGPAAGLATHAVPIATALRPGWMGPMDPRRGKRRSRTIGP